METKEDRKAFINLPYRAYAGQPAWRAPLLFERNEHFDINKNIGLQSIDLALFLASRDGNPVGRIAAFVNHRHLDRHKDGTGHFGFFDTLEADDAETAAGLFRGAEAWLKQKGMTRIGGPYNFSVNDECGLLVDGFDTPPAVMMPYGRPDYPELLEQNGYAKAMDMFALRHQMGDAFSPPSFVARLKKRFDANPSYSVRPLNRSTFSEDIGLIMDIYNDAWSENWGYIPITQEESDYLAGTLKPLLRSDAVWISFIDGEPASFTLMLPNINEAARDLNGRLLPFGWAKLLYRLKLAPLCTARIPLAGTMRKFHKSRKGMTATVGSWDACLRAQHARGVREVEFSWVLETNEDLLGLADIYQCERYKTYRIYDKAL